MKHQSSLILSLVTASLFYCSFDLKAVQPLQKKGTMVAVDDHSSLLSLAPAMKKIPSEIWKTIIVPYLGIRTIAPTLWAATLNQRVEFRGHTGDIRSAVFNHDGSKVVTASSARVGNNDNSTRVWDAESGAQLCRIDHAIEVQRAYFNDDGTQVLTQADSKLLAWVCATGQNTPLTKRQKFLAGFQAFNLSADGSRALTYKNEYNRSVVRIVHPAEQKFVHELSVEGGHPWVHSAGFDHSGLRAFTVGDDKAYIWDTQSGKKLHEIISRGARGASFNTADTRVVLFGTIYGAVYDTANANLLFNLTHDFDPGHNDWVHSAQFNNNDSLVSLKSCGGTSEFDAQNGKLLRKLPTPNWLVRDGFPNPTDKSKLLLKVAPNYNYVAIIASPINLEGLSPEQTVFLSLMEHHAQNERPCFLDSHTRLPISLEDVANQYKQEPRELERVLGTFDQTKITAKKVREVYNITATSACSTQ